MSYKALSLHTRNKITQFNHEALQYIQHFSLNISLCYYLAPASLEAEASHSQHICSSATKPPTWQNEAPRSSKQSYLWELQSHLLQQH